jgi:hypothetical protein
MCRQLLVQSNDQPLDARSADHQAELGDAATQQLRSLEIPL